MNTENNREGSICKSVKHISVKETIIDMFGIESIGTAELRINGEARTEFDVFDIADLELFADRGLIVAFIMSDDNMLYGELIDVDADDSRMVLKTDKNTVSFLYNVFEWFIIIGEKEHR